MGKSFVLGPLARATGGLYYQASKRTENEQLLNLSQAIGAAFNEVTLQRGVPFPNWEALLDDLTDRARRRPLLVVLDEFPYLAAAAPGLTSLIQWFRYCDPACVTPWCRATQIPRESLTSVCEKLNKLN